MVVLLVILVLLVFLMCQKRKRPELSPVQRPNFTIVIVTLPNIDTITIDLVPTPNDNTFGEGIFKRKIVCKQTRPKLG